MNTKPTIELFQRLAKRHQRTAKWYFGGACLSVILVIIIVFFGISRIIKERNDLIRLATVKLAEVDSNHELINDRLHDARSLLTYMLEGLREWRFYTDSYVTGDEFLNEAQVMDLIILRSMSDSYNQELKRISTTVPRRRGEIMDEPKKLGEIIDEPKKLGEIIIDLRADLGEVSQEFSEVYSKLIEVNERLRPINSQKRLFNGEFDNSVVDEVIFGQNFFTSSIGKQLDEEGKSSVRESLDDLDLIALALSEQGAKSEEIVAVIIAQIIMSLLGIYLARVFLRSYDKAVSLSVFFETRVTLLSSLVDYPVEGLTLEDFVRIHDPASRIERDGVASPVDQAESIIKEALRNYANK